MKFLKIFLLTAVVSISMISCNENEIDTEKPNIDLSIADAFPINCDTIYLGETFTMKLKFTDNVELGSYSIDIHNNFDHHSHSTEMSSCEFDPDKQAVNPYKTILDYEIEDGLKEYETNLEIEIPSSNANGDFDEGDYHFFISLTDNEGWSAQKGLSIKMLKR